MFIRVLLCIYIHDQFRPYIHDNIKIIIYVNIIYDDILDFNHIFMRGPDRPVIIIIIKIFKDFRSK